MNKHEIRSVTAELRVAASEDGTRTLTGFIPYNTESVDLGGFTEVIAPGAFAEALQPTSDVLALRDHDAKLLMGRTKSGTLIFTDATDGLRYQVKLPNTTAANDLAESIERGDLDGTSFGFSTDEDKWINADGKVIRTLLKVNLFEVSPCSFPAYPDSGIALRSAPVEIRSLIETHDDDNETDSIADQCQCHCPACSEDNCADCSNADCEDDLCDCDDSSEEDSLRNAMHMILSIRQRR
ncbi:HK97 family phage prohead protease [Granulicella cerasi]|uniref:HK97 family phage prohead protease n=1 Tax=Granulicella cerasi TaxID=741063 RepID=A0ABW1Z568_9BACT|nr:HK97 family phage prohead protease [Granulicella cerasi]